MAPDRKTAILSYRDLIVWQEAMDLAESAYRTTSKFPKEEATISPLLEKAGRVGKMLRGLIRSLENTGQP